VDLFLIHSPNAGPEAVKSMWQPLEKAHQEGKIKAIGVSNFGKGQIEAMKGYAKTMPVVNQIEVYHTLAPCFVAEWTGKG
jgi:diketogulonate reductase-like aldo/keto reductase